MLSESSGGELGVRGAAFGSQPPIPSPVTESSSEMQ